LTRNTVALPAALLSIAWIVAAAPATATAETGDKVACTYDPGNANTCAPFACLPDVPPGTDPFQIEAGTPGFCGRCDSDRVCGGAQCRTDTGRCSTYDASPAPRPVWPHFNLLIADASFNFADAGSPKPIIGAGYLFQGAFKKTHPEKFDGHGFLTPELPRLYWNAGASLAMAGPAQNAFLDAGLTLYIPSAPAAITALSLGALYQRQGASIWKLNNGTENEDRLGPMLAVGFLQNVFLRVAYVFPLRGPTDHGAVIVGAAYMKDLLGDVVPDRFRKFLPSKLK
jgi:hypothetical protein